MVTEVRIYKLKANSSEQFLKVFTEQSLPVMLRWKVTVVDYGLSRIDNESFYLIRRYNSISERKQSQDAFYNSSEWKLGPEHEIMNYIDTYNTAVIENTFAKF